MYAATSFVLKQSLQSATPLVIAGMGELVAQRCGVINVGIEGLMLMGCIAAYGGALLTGSAIGGVATAAIVGILFAAVFGLVTIWGRADQIVAGTAMNILAFGASTTLWTSLQKLQRPPTTFAMPPLFDPLNVPGLSSIPLIGPAIFQQYTLFYVAILASIVLGYALTFTRFGLITRALGDAPEACDAAGISVRGWRTLCVLAAGAAAGIAGSYLSIMRGHSFQINMTGGQGFLVLALVIFGRWNVAGLVLGTLMFGAIDGLQTYLAGIPQAAQVVPHQLFDMLPYLATLVALAILSRSRAGPACLGKPWPQ